MIFTQSERLLQYFRAHNNVLTTADFRDHPGLWAEYRRAMCDLKNAGHTILSRPLEKNL